MNALIRLAYLTVCGAVLGGPLAVWLLMPGLPGPGEAGCGNEVLGAFLFGLPGGALLGGLLGLTAALILNRWVYRLRWGSEPGATDGLCHHDGDFQDCAVKRGP